jgi:hypothetical protein
MVWIVVLESKFFQEHSAYIAIASDELTFHFVSPFSHGWIVAQQAVPAKELYVGHSFHIPHDIALSNAHHLETNRPQFGQRFGNVRPRIAFQVAQKFLKSRISYILSTG